MKDKKTHKDHSFSTEVGGKEARKLQAQKEKLNVWSGLGLFGMIGWSITIPTLLGAALGIWLDRRTEVDFSWTLSLLVAGLMLGCVIAWNWVQKETKEIENNKDVKNE